ncbi:MAG TPA: hypothetical protein VLM38_08635 [Blastocatellia bacterium]|nr:hypothetical protein [Blastocatellia bacterium]
MISEHAEDQFEMDAVRAKRILRLGIRLKCPRCGLGRLYESPFRMRTRCDYCDLIFEREQGYFVGSIYINVVATESTLLFTLLIYGLVTGTVNEGILSVLVVLAIIVPLTFFHHSRSLWLSFDHILNPPERPVSREVETSE